MENVPSTPDDGTDKKSTGKKAKKRAATLGIFAIEPKSFKSEPVEDIWQKLTLTKRRAGKTETVVPLVQLEDESVARTPEASETEAPLETLGSAEEQYALREIITNGQETEADQSEDQSEANSRAAEAIALFRDKMLVEGLDPDQAFAETLQSLGTEDSPAEHNQQIDMLSDEASKNPRALTEYLDFQSAQPSPPEFIHGEADSESKEDKDERNRLKFTNTAQTLTGTGNIPPPPINRLRGTAATGPSFPLAGNTIGPRTDKEQVPGYTKNDVMSAALLGGIIGYFIGRRRGRIKTEKKLKPIQKKLEKQVMKLHEDIRAKEFYIRKVANQSRQDRQRIFQMERDQRNADQTRPIALEANQLHGKVSPEHIGRVLVAAKGNHEAVNKAKTPAEKRVPVLDNQRIETMDRNELLSLSEKIAVENTTLRQVYETHLVTEQGLRRLVSEYAHGGDIQKAVREELMEHEIDFERDPILRDQSRPAAAAASSDTLGNLLQKAEVLSEAETKDELAVLKARQTHHETQRHQQQTRRRVIDTTMIVAIAVLFALVVTLLMRGR